MNSHDVGDDEGDGDGDSEDEGDDSCKGDAAACIDGPVTAALIERFTEEALGKAQALHPLQLLGGASTACGADGGVSNMSLRGAHC